MAKFKFEVQTEEYADYLKFACAPDMLALLHKVTADLKDLRLTVGSPNAMYVNIGIDKLTMKIDTFLDVVS